MTQNRRLMWFPAYHYRCHAWILMVTLLVSSITNAQAPPPSKQPSGKVTPFGIGKSEITQPKQKIGEVPDELRDYIVLYPSIQVAESPLKRPNLLVELVRQSFWLTANKEFRLRVRDASLGEYCFPKLPADRQFTFQSAHPIQGLMTWNLHATSGKMPFQLWTGGLKSEPQYQQSYLPLLVESEELSRGDFKIALQAMGFQPVASKLSTATVPDQVKQLLTEMTETSQFAAVRQIHAEIQKQGESEDLTESLIRGYANLGLLTDYFWSAKPAVFQARSLLLAQREVARNATSPRPLWHRAYALAMVGLHADAIQDLSQAEQLNSTAKLTVPEWVPLIQAFLEFRSEDIETIQQKSPSELVGLLHFITIDSPQCSHLTLTIGEKLLQRIPECYRVRSSMCNVPGVIHNHTDTSEWLKVLQTNITNRVLSIPNVPKSVQQVKMIKNPDQYLYGVLNQASIPAKDDTGEPSWSALGSIIRDVQFASVWSRLHFVSMSLGLPTERESSVLLDQITDHPLTSLIKSFQYNRYTNGSDVLAALTIREAKELDMRARSYYFHLAQLSPKDGDTWHSSAYQRTGITYFDQSQILNGYSVDEWKSFLAQNIATISPFSPQGKVAVILNSSNQKPDWYRTQEKSRHPLVHQALAYHYSSIGKTDDAIRCWKRRIELSPDFIAFRALADIYKQQNKIDLWLETMEDVLKHGDPGLGHSRVQHDIARYYMSIKDYTKARPYAIASAESFAGWALLCAGECEVELENWDSANDYFRAVSERYELSIFEWYTMCQSTGKMDIEGARKLILDYKDSLKGAIPLSHNWQFGRFYLMEGDLRAAHRLFAAIPSNIDNFVPIMFATLISAQLKNKDPWTTPLKLMDELERDNPMKSLFVKPTKPTRTWAEKNVVPTAEQVKVELDKLADAERPDAAFYIGWYLHIHGDSERARELWKTCANSKLGSPYLRTHARVFLRTVKPAGSPK